MSNCITFYLFILFDFTFFTRIHFAISLFIRIFNKLSFKFFITLKRAVIDSVLYGLLLSRIKKIFKQENFCIKTFFIYPDGISYFVLNSFSNSCKSCSVEGFFIFREIFLLSAKYFFASFFLPVFSKS